MKLILCTILVLLLTACHNQPKGWDYKPVVGGNPLPLEDAKAICEKEAEDASYQSNTPEYQRAFEVHTYRECMQTNGWLARYVREVF